MRYSQAGRPPKYRPEMPGTVRAYLRRCEAEGQRPSMTALAAELGISRPTLYAWLRRRPELVEAVKALPVVQSLH